MRIATPGDSHVLNKAINLSHHAVYLHSILVVLLGVFRRLLDDHAKRKEDLMRGNAPTTVPFSVFIGHTIFVRAPLACAWIAKGS